jgi:ATP-dependent DNA helicase RecQ
VYRAAPEALARGPARAEELAAFIDSRNPMAVDTALGTLRREGVLVRELDSDTGATFYRLSDETAAGAPLALDFEVLEAKRRNDDERLHDMCTYAAGAACRRAFVLRYFGSHEARERCEACDRCLGVGRPEARPLADDERRDVRIALSGVARVNDRYGRSRLAQFLNGSKTAGVKETGLADLPTYGMLKHLGLRQVGDLLETLADAGLLARRALDGPGSGAILSLTSEGKRVMLDDPPLSLSLPRHDRRAAATHAARPAKRTSFSAKTVAAGVDDQLAARLRAWRLEEAQSRQVPPYAVFPDTTLVALATLRPSHANELLTVPGIGPARLERYGAALLELFTPAPPA